MLALQIKPTDEQVAILDRVREAGNLQINALAGTGKTATLKMADKVIDRRKLPVVMVWDHISRQELPYNVLYLVFNKRNAQEAIDSGEFHPETLIKTLNSCGYWIWARTIERKLVVNPKKTMEHFREHISEWTKEQQSDAWAEWPNIRQGIELAKALGYIPDKKYPLANHLCNFDELNRNCDEPLSPLSKELIDALLFRSIQTAYKGYVDYNDQIYMPSMFQAAYPRFPLVMADEAQDFSPVNHAMLDKLGKARVLSVGDPAQSIYGFRGAQQAGMESLRQRFAMSEADLSISFRCPKAIVESVHWRVPNFKWSKPGGLVGTIDNPRLDCILDDSAIICRNNAPLFRLALRLLASGRSVRVHGSDMGPRIAGIMKKLGPEGMRQASVMSAISDWEAERLENGNKTAKDIAECMRVFAMQGPTLQHALAYIDHIFAQSGTIELLTGHKAKGLEWDRIYFLDEWLIGEDEQERNLRYVIMTRSKNELYLINSKDIR